MIVQYPKYEQELIRLGTKDQAEIRSHNQKLKSLASNKEQELLHRQLKKHCHARALKMMEILTDIIEPSISNIGEKGSQWVSVLSLHSYLDEMKVVLDAYQKAYQKNPLNVCKDSIPSLTDRIMVIKLRKQLYGNNWMVDKNGKYFLIPVIDFSHMNDRRAQFGLGPRMKPIVYAIGENKYPLGKGLAEESDQKELTEEEYAKLVVDHIR